MTDAGTAKRIRLVHWNEAEAKERAERLRATGHRVDSERIAPAGLRALAEDPPDAIVIDLDRLPSQGRDLGLQLRTRAGTRQVPLVFVGGRPDKVQRVRELLPDAEYTTWAEIHAVLEQVEPLAEPLVPASVFAAYTGTPLPKKLGIKAGDTVALVGAPEAFENPRPVQRSRLLSGNHRGPDRKGNLPALLAEPPGRRLCSGCHGIGGC